MHLASVTVKSDRFPDPTSYPFNQPILQNAPTVNFTTPVTMFAGENGAGKSTLLEAICRRCGIHIWQAPDRSRVTVNPHESELYRFMSVDWVDGPAPGSFFGSETFRYFSRSLDDWGAADPGILKYFGGQSLVTQSHGQSMLAYFRARYAIPGLYLLDEPETALSPESQLQLVRILMDNALAGHAQFIMVTHSPILLACPGARILTFDEVPLRDVAYQETAYYRIYREFMNDPAGYLAKMKTD